LPLHVAPAVTLAAGLAVVDAIEGSVPSVTLGVKWPNDVLADGKKIAGILCESQIVDGALGFLVVGVGINVRTREFPGELAALATSMSLCGAGHASRGDLLIALCQTLATRLDALGTSGVVELTRELARRDALRGRSIIVEGAAGVALGIAEDGSLRVRMADGSEKTFAAGEVTLARE
jgi:BirA family transcriptional regulator, biotin operon repressor / biotin---[acetyl-CoA-carboxylase] ligase